MELMQAIRERRSIRKYKKDPICGCVIGEIIEAARLAPSWNNGQCWRFILVRDPEMLQRVAGDNFGAPLCIVACGIPAGSGHNNGQDYYLVDVAIAMEHLVLAAADKGLGTCWVAGRVLKEKVIKEALGIPEEIRVVAMTPLGYPDEGLPLAATKKRRSVEEIFFNERWGA
ncbi:MAG: nitroreductase family protein [bacterium]|jgi:nitroreductase|nr:nitroreductase family protein [bacterium]MDD3804806.1 nitroreductase family protein [bacterium]MDD4152995.1 nitroreductase family protein [bacterium]MDD4558196.1 nitroreductase family protein [bacterium]